MPALPIIADTYRVAFQWVGQSGQSAISVLHFHKTGGTAAGVASDIDTNIAANMWTHTNTNTKVTALHVTPLDGSSSTFVLGVTGSKWAGTSGAADTSPASAVVVSLRTALRGRSNRGRIFLPFCTENVISDGSLLSANVAIGQAAWNSFLAAMVSPAAQLVVASYKLAQQHAVTSILYEQALGTQRRRQERLRP